MHALCIDLVYHRDCCRELRPLMQCVCTCGAVDNRSQRFGYDIVALPTSLLCSHRCYKCRDSCSPPVRRDVVARPLRNADKIAVKSLLPGECILGGKGQKSE